jgi:hypothetical protein
VRDVVAVRRRGALVAEDRGEVVVVLAAGVVGAERELERGGGEREREGEAVGDLAGGGGGREGGTSF